MKYGVAINDQGRYAPTIVADFIYQPKEGIHVWRGIFATDAKQLATQVNDALEALKSWADPFLTLRVVEIEPEKDEAENNFDRQPFDTPVGVTLTEKLRRIKQEDLKGAFEC